MFLIYTGIILLGITLCFAWYKFVWLIFNPIINFLESKKNKENNNPYIVAQKLINTNDKKYDEYLRWLQKNEGGVPIEKIKTKEEIEAEIKIKKLFS